MEAHANRPAIIVVALLLVVGAIGASSVLLGGQTSTILSAVGGSIGNSPRGRRTGVASTCQAATKPSATRNRSMTARTPATPSVNAIIAARWSCDVKVPASSTEPLDTR